MFELRKVTKTFEGETATDRALEPTSITVQPGEFLCLMGPSGCGKSTLLRIMAGLEKPTSGQIINRPQRLSFVFQNFGLFPWLSVEDNVGFGLKMAGVSHGKSTKIVRTAIEDIGLSGLEGRHPKELSGGQRQRVGIARALTMNPEVLLLDEPFSALDVLTADDLRRDLLAIWEQRSMTIVMVTHLPEEAAELSSRVAVMSPRPGRITDVVANDLPRPRNRRSTAFYRLEDKLESLIKN